MVVAPKVGLNDFINLFTSAEDAPDNGVGILLLFLAISGKALVPSSIPNQSVDPLFPVRKLSLKCILGLYPVDAEILNIFFVGKSFVSIFNKPPAKSAGIFGKKFLETVILSISAVGKISICNEFLSGSKPGKSNPFIVDFEYLSPKPLTYTYFPPSIETPVTLFAASTAVPSPISFIFAEEIPSTIAADFLFMVVIPSSEFFCKRLEETTTSFNSVLTATNVISGSTVTLF